MKINFAFLFFLLPLLMQAQGGLFISSGANVVVANSPHIIIENGKFSNDGDFLADNSTVHISGTNTTENSTIGGVSITAFNNLNIEKSSNDVRLDFDIGVDGNLQMDGGNLFLNNSDITLGGDIVGESGSKRITGTSGGAILKSVTLNMPVGENPGNLGAEITSSENLGSTTIYRRHTQMTNNGNHSIYRYFDIVPTNNTGLDATLRFHYFDEELAGLTESDLEIWQFDGVNWSSKNLNNINMGANWVEASGFPFFHTLTLAEEMNQALPIELLSFDALLNERKEVDIFWTTTTEVNNDFFSVERSRNGVAFEQIAVVDGAGNSINTHQYKITDSSPFIGINYYRLKQVDFDGSQTYSIIRPVNIISDERFIAYPNPMNNELHISGDGFSAEGDLIIEIYDALGKLVYNNSLAMDAKFNSFTIKEVSELIGGNYFLSIQSPVQQYTFNLVKVRE
jgi:hypothetical protein